MNIFSNIEFLNKGYFILILFVFLIVYFFYIKQKSGINFLFIKEARDIFSRNTVKFYLKIVLLFLILLNFLVLLANPNITNISKKEQKNGIDIVIALDISLSMEAEDLKPSRIEAAKGVIDNFISKLKTDRLGLVVFAGKPFTSIPLTFDYNILTETISNLGTNNIDQQQRGLNGTAVGDSILMAKTLFKAPEGVSKEEYDKREKVIILLTDGDANVGVDPVLAGLSAKESGIKVYTIGIGSKQGGILTYNLGPFKRQQKIPPLNDESLKQIAKDTGASYFRAEDNDSFNSIFDELSNLEKNDINIEIKKQYSEYYEVFLYSLLVLLSIFTYLMLNTIEVRKNNN